MTRVAIHPALLHWAADRAGRPWDVLAAKFPLSEWEKQQRQPTLRQLEAFAAATHVPVGKLFLQQPPSEPLPLPDFRSMGNTRGPHPSGNLLDMIYTCQIRQDWYREFARSESESPFRLAIEASADPERAADRLRAILRAPLAFPTNPYLALHELTNLADAAGVLVMASGVVGNNTHRKLAVEEFRGFVMADEWAPLIFINGADSLRAQLFTLAHELMHLLQGQSGISEAQPEQSSGDRSEHWCNQAAAALLVPASALEIALRGATIDAGLQQFPVSRAVVLIRAHHLGLISRKRLDYELLALSEAEVPQRKSSGGNFYNSVGRRLGRRFARAVIAQTQQGHTPFLEALDLLGLKDDRTFSRLLEHLEGE